MIPGLIELGIETFETYSKVKTLIDEDRSMTPEERAQLETMIAEQQAIVRGTSRDSG